MVRQQPKVIIGEPTMLEIFHAHKGCFEFTATASGKAAHSSSRDGVNANLKLIPFLAALKEIYDQSETDVKFHNNAFDPPTLSMNISLKGDRSAHNVTASRASCTVNFRPMPDVDHTPIVLRVRELAEKFDLKLKLNDYGAALWTDPESDFVKQSLELVHGKSAKTAAFGTDGGVLGELNDKIVCGPGNIKQAHTKNEWIGLEQLHRGTEVFAKMIAHWCC
jgi:acetylornithine deacetylase